MTDAPASGVSTSELLRESWRLLRGHARLFVLLMGVAILAQLLAVLLMVFFICLSGPCRCCFLPDVIPNPLALFTNGGEGSAFRARAAVVFSRMSSRTRSHCLRAV